MKTRIYTSIGLSIAMIAVTTAATGLAASNALPLTNSTSTQAPGFPALPPENKSAAEEKGQDSVDLPPLPALKADEDKSVVLDVQYVATPQAVVNKMLEMAKIKPGEVLYDLGCGDGRIMVTAAKKYGIKTMGVDIDPARVREAIDNARTNGVSHLVTVKKENIFAMDLRGADVVTMFLLPTLNVRLMPQLEQVKPGSRILSYQFDMKGARPSETVRMRLKGDKKDEPSMNENQYYDHLIFLWNVPWTKETD